MFDLHDPIENSEQSTVLYYSSHLAVEEPEALTSDLTSPGSFRAQGWGYFFLLLKKLILLRR